MRASVRAFVSSCVIMCTYFDILIKLTTSLPGVFEVKRVLSITVVIDVSRLTLNHWGGGTLVTR